jgi:hypothetical protein
VKGSTRNFLMGVFALTVLAAGLRLWGIDTGLPHLMTRPDEEILLFKTRHPASGSLDLNYKSQHPGVPSAYIFGLWAVGEVGLRVEQLLSLAEPGSYLETLDRAPEKILVVHRMLSALAGVATVLLLALVARSPLGTGPALAAGAMLAFCFLHVRESHSAKPDVTLAFWCMAALHLLSRLAEQTTTRRGAAAGIAIGLGMASKPPAVLLFAPAWVASVLGSSDRGWRRLLPGSLIVAGVVAGLVFLITSPDLIFNAETRNQVAGIVYLVFPSLAEDPATTSPVTEAQPFTHEISPFAGHIYYATFALRHGFGPVAVVLAPFAVGWGLLSRKHLPVLCAIFVTVGFLAFGASPALHARYMVPLLPPLALLLAGFLHAWATRMTPPRLVGPVLTAMTALVVAQPLWSSISFDRIAARPDTRVLASRWMADSLPKDATLAMAGTVFWSWGEPQIPPGIRVTRTGLDPARIDEAGADFLLTHDHPLFSSTIDEEELRRLEPGLRLRAEFDPFVGGHTEPLFDRQDAYYIPMAGLSAVERSGPAIRIYEVLPATGP